jgi:hypothetical protein
VGLHQNKRLLYIEGSNHQSEKTTEKYLHTIYMIMGLVSKYTRNSYNSTGFYVVTVLGPLSYNDSLEELTELRKAVRHMVMVYCSEWIQIKISKGKSSQVRGLESPAQASCCPLWETVETMPW